MARILRSQIDASARNAKPSPMAGSLGENSVLLMVLIAIGFGLFRAWSVIGGSPTLFVFAESVSFEVEHVAAFWEDVTYALVMLLLGVLSLRSGFVRREPLMVFSCAVLCLATVLFLVVPAFGVDAFPASVVGRILYAFAACAAVLWGEQLCLVGVRESLICIAGAYALSYALAYMGTYLPVSAMPAVQISLLVLSSAFWFCARREAGAAETGAVLPEPAKLSFCKPMRDMPYRVFFGVGVFGAVLLLANGLSEGKTTVPNELLTLVSGLVTSFSIFAISIFLKREIDFTFVFRLMLPIIVVCIFLVFFIETDQQPYEVVFIGFSWTFFIVFAWEIWRIAASKASLPALSVFAFGSALLSACSLAAGGLGMLARWANVSNLVIVAFACVASVLAATFLLNDQKVREAVRDKTVLLDRSDEDACQICVDQAASAIGLTEREAEIALRVLQGKDNSLIAKELFITTATLYTHLRNMYKKAEVHSKREFFDLLRSFAQ